MSLQSWVKEGWREIIMFFIPPIGFSLLLSGVLINSDVTGILTAVTILMVSFCMILSGKMGDLILGTWEPWGLDWMAPFLKFWGYVGLTVTLLYIVRFLITFGINELILEIVNLI